MFELLRSWLFTGFPWLLLGYSQTDTYLNGFSPLFGVYGLSTLCAFLSGALIAFLKQKKTLFRLEILTVAILIFLSGFLLTKINWTTSSGQPIKTTMIQGNIQQNLKWQPEQLLSTLKLYMEYTQANWSSHLIIWPEAAIPLPLEEAKDFLFSISNMAKKNNCALITGIPVVKSNFAFNSVIALGNGRGIYYKRHLVPFGEYIPLKPLFEKMLQTFQIPMSNFQHGAKTQSPLIANGVYIAPYICYEVAYPLEFLMFLPKAQLLITVTDDSWFGRSVALSQHLQMAQMRASETGRYLLFNSNTGLTAVLNPKGKITKSVAPFQERALTATVLPMQGETPWMIWRMYPVFGFMLMAILVRLKILLSPFIWLLRNSPGRQEFPSLKKGD